jgi:class 3 adenylate cyclase/tetratricopeptide (TPR) repeat protein
MKCAECQFENPEGMQFCGKCGARLEITCSKCGFSNPPQFTFCGKCGQELGEVSETEEPIPETDAERKHVTVLFSDLSGYTSMSERLDPEDAKETMNQIFGEIAQVVSRYDGFIEKFIGDAVMALFGAPTSHEDDPIRAIRAAREIHDVVGGMNPRIEERLGESLSMHVGINTGLVVTGEVNLERGTHGVSGDTVNVASRLSSLAGPGETVVGPETYRQAEGYFTFETMESTTVKGKTEPIQVYKVLSPKEEPSTIHRVHGLRADLIGRKVEMAQLSEAVERLHEGKGTILSICGDAGTGKSRLVEEFKATLDLKEVQWREGHAYAYSQNIPYFTLMDLLNRAWHIEEGDATDEIRNKIQTGIEGLVGKTDIVPYVGSLYSLTYPEIEGVSPEFWKSRLQQAIHAILSALSQRAPTVICLEDIQWADPSSLDLLRFLLSELRYPALFLCAYRPPFSLFTSHRRSSLGDLYQEIRLQDLSSSEAEDMMESLLKTKTIPSELRRFVQKKVEGNPFYVEEVINALIESGTLAPDNGSWKLTQSIREVDIPSTVHGVISARLDRLEREAKRILQEASVIGRAFLYEILKKTTELKDQMDRCLSVLERLDLIRTRSLEPDLEYVFKHALTQEVVYNGLLKKERREIHERIGLVMEQLFQDRLSEFSETLAFHFAQGQSIRKAVDYLMQSGEKSLKRYAVEESHQYFKEAFDILASKPERTKEEDGLLIDLLIKWAYVFYYRGDFRGLVDLLSAHQDLAESLDDRAKLGMFYCRLAWGLHCRERFEDAYQYLCKSLEIGEEIDNPHVIGYACAWLTWTCTEMGRLDEAIAHGERAQTIFESLESDHYLYFKSLGGMGHAYWIKGERRKASEAGQALLEFGHKHSNIRSMVMGYYVKGYSHMIEGDFPSAIESFQKGVQISADPFYTQMPRCMLGFSYLYNGQLQEAEEELQEVDAYSEDSGCEVLGTPTQMGLAAISVGKGQISQGLRTFENGLRACLKNQRKSCYALFQRTLGQVYLQIVDRKGPISLSTMARNIGFLVKNLPLARKKGEDHLNESIKAAREIGANGILGQAYLILGFLHRANGKEDQARECLGTAVQVLEQCEAEVFVRQATEALDTLDKEGS